MAEQLSRGAQRATARGRPDLSVIEQVPPHNLEAEQALLASVFVSSDALDEARSAGVSSKSFYRESHALIFEAMIKLRERGEPIDLITLPDALADNLDAAGGHGYIVDLACSTPTSHYASHYAELVVGKAFLRTLRRFGQAVAGWAMEPGAEAAEVREKALQTLVNIDNSRQAKTLMNIQDVGAEYLEELHAIAERGAPKGLLTTGWHDVDHVMQPAPGDLYILAARPAMGKTALALNWACHVARSAPVLIVSLEMDRRQLYRRMVASLTGISTKRQMSGQLSDEEHRKITDAIAHIHELNLHIETGSGASVEDIKAACRRLAARGQKPALVVVDYLQLMSSPGVENRTQEVSTISRGLKQTGMEFECVVLALSQLSREVEKRPDKRPLLSDLRESGSIEADADVVWFIYRDDYYAKQERRESKAHGLAELIGAKHRNGEVATFNLCFDPARQQFSDYHGQFGYIELPA